MPFSSGIMLALQ